MAYLAFTGNAYQRLLVGMSNIAVTRDAGKHLPCRLVGKHQMDKIAVAIQTRMQRDPAIAGFNLYGFVEVACGKGEGMEKTIVHFGHPFTEEVMRQVAVVADCHLVMARFLPGIEMALHHVTRGTRPRVVAEITPTLTVTEGIDADTHQHPEHDHEQGWQPSNGMKDVGPPAPAIRLRRPVLRFFGRAVRQWLLYVATE
jgi:hypothetical protein